MNKYYIIYFYYLYNYIIIYSLFFFYFYLFNFYFIHIIFLLYNQLFKNIYTCFWIIDSQKLSFKKITFSLGGQYSHNFAKPNFNL
jgi:hypothetical protein